MAKKQQYLENASEADKKKYDKYTAEDEELILATGLAKMYLHHQLVYYVVFPGIVFVILGVIWAVVTGNNLGVGMLIGLAAAVAVSIWKTWILNMSTKYLLTTRRVLVKKGLLTVRLSAALYDKITHIEVEQGFVDRVFLNHGTVIINTAGSNKDELVLKYVESPISFKNLLERLINREREHYGRATGPVVAVEGELVE